MNKTVIQPHKSSLGMQANIAVLVIYIAMAVVSWIPYLGWIAWVVPIIFYVMEKESKFVKFQAAQALVIGIIRAVFAIVLQIFVWILTPHNVYDFYNLAVGRSWGAWVLLGTISTIIGIIITLVEVYIIFQAYRWKQVELPIIGPMAAKASAKMDHIDTSKLGSFRPDNSNPANSNQPNGNLSSGNPTSNTPAGGAPLNYRPTSDTPANGNSGNPANETKQVIYCPNCGKPNTSSTKFCGDCGQKLS